LATAWQQKLARVYFWSTAFGFDGLKLSRSLRGLVPTVRDYTAIRRQNRESGSRYRVRFTAPCLDDRIAEAGSASGHYFHQDLHVAQAIFRRNPRRHVDVGSRIDGFVAHVASFRPIEVFDIRPLDVVIPNVTFRQLDIADPAAAASEQADSVSCLHALEHVGLGRYGDPVAIDGYKEAFKGLEQLVCPGGTLYLSVPIGRERVEFNGHRVFDVRTILGLAAPTFALRRFAFVDDDGALHTDAAVRDEVVDSNYGCHYGCGIFEFEKHRVN
jgi:hypothetical protein